MSRTHALEVEAQMSTYTVIEHAVERWGLGVSCLRGRGGGGVGTAAIEVDARRGDAAEWNDT